MAATLVPRPAIRESGRIDLHLTIFVRRHSEKPLRICPADQKRSSIAQASESIIFLWACEWSNLLDGDGPAMFGVVDGTFHVQRSLGFDNIYHVLPCAHIKKTSRYATFGESVVRFLLLHLDHLYDRN
jgi:hypothetical protein